MLRGYAGDQFEAAEDAAIELKPSDDIKQLVIVTSCLGCRVKLGSRTADELSRQMSLARYDKHCLMTLVWLDSMVWASFQLRPQPHANCTTIR